MKFLLAVLLSAFIADAALAASLGFHVTSGAKPGDAVTIDILATIETGDPIILGLDLRLTAGGGIEWTGSTQTPLTSFGGGVNWTQFAPICSGGDPCVAVNQGNPALATGYRADPVSGILAKVTGIVGPAGNYAIQLVAVGEDFFGAPNPPAFAFFVVPQPTTVGLLGLGFAGLAVLRRRRTSKSVAS